MGCYCRPRATTTKKVATNVHGGAGAGVKPRRMPALALCCPCGLRKVSVHICHGQTRKTSSSSWHEHLALLAKPVC